MRWDVFPTYNLKTEELSAKDVVHMVGKMREVARHHIGNALHEIKESILIEKDKEVISYLEEQEEYYLKLSEDEYLSNTSLGYNALVVMADELGLVNV